MEYYSEDDNYDMWRDLADQSIVRYSIQHPSTRNYMVDTRSCHERRLDFVREQISKLELTQKNMTPIDKQLYQQFINERNSIEEKINTQHSS